MLTPHQFIAVAVRLFALWLLLTSAQIALLAYAMRSTVQHDGEASFVLAAIYLSLLTMLLLSGQGIGQAPSLHVDGLIGIAMLMIGGTLVLRCRTLAARILPRPSATPSR